MATEADCEIETTAATIESHLEGGDDLSDDLEKLLALSKERKSDITCLVTIKYDLRD